MASRLPLRSYRRIPELLWLTLGVARQLERAVTLVAALLTLGVGLVRRPGAPEGGTGTGRDADTRAGTGTGVDAAPAGRHTTPAA